MVILALSAKAVSATSSATRSGTALLFAVLLLFVAVPSAAANESDVPSIEVPNPPEDDVDATAVSEAAEPVEDVSPEKVAVVEYLQPSAADTGISPAPVLVADDPSPAFALVPSSFDGRIRPATSSATGNQAIDSLMMATADPRDDVQRAKDKVHEAQARLEVVKESLFKTKLIFIVASIDHAKVKDGPPEEEKKARQKKKEAKSHFEGIKEKLSYAVEQVAQAKAELRSAKLAKAEKNKR